MVVDGEAIGDLANGEAASFPVEAGAHTLWVGVEGGGSIATFFNATAGATTAFRCRADGLASSLWGSVWGRERYLVVEPDPTAYRPVTDAETLPNQLAS